MLPDTVSGKKRGWKGDNRDLWEALGAELTETPGRTVFSKVKAHCTWRDVQHGRITMFDFLGNSKADALAVGGAEQRDFATEVLRAAEDTREHCVAVHKEMVAI